MGEQGPTNKDAFSRIQTQTGATGADKLSAKIRGERDARNTREGLAAVQAELEKRKGGEKPEPVIETPEEKPKNGGLEENDASGPTEVVGEPNIKLTELRTAETEKLAEIKAHNQEDKEGLDKLYADLKSIREKIRELVGKKEGQRDLKTEYEEKHIVLLGKIINHKQKHPEDTVGSGGTLDALAEELRQLVAKNQEITKQAETIKEERELAQWEAMLRTKYQFDWNDLNILTSDDLDTIEKLLDRKKEELKGETSRNILDTYIFKITHHREEMGWAKKENKKTTPTAKEPAIDIDDATRASSAVRIGGRILDLADPQVNPHKRGVFKKPEWLRNKKSPQEVIRRGIKRVKGEFKSTFESIKKKKEGNLVKKYDIVMENIHQYEKTHPEAKRGPDKTLDRLWQELRVIQSKLSGKKLVEIPKVREEREAVKPKPETKRGLTRKEEKELAAIKKELKKRGLI